MQEYDHFSVLMICSPASIVVASVPHYRWWPVYLHAGGEGEVGRGHGNMGITARPWENTDCCWCRLNGQTAANVLSSNVWLLFVGSSGQWRHTPPIAVHNGCFVESGGTVPDFRSLWKSLSVVTHLSKMILCFRVIPRMFFGKIQKICYEHWKWNVKVAVGPWLVATICWCLYSCTTATTGHSN